MKNMIHKLASKLQNWQGKYATHRAAQPKRAKARPNRFVPRLESLDDRCVPTASVSVTPAGVMTISDTSLTVNNRSDEIIIVDNGQSTAGNMKVATTNAFNGQTTVWDQVTANQHITKVCFTVSGVSGSSPVVEYSQPTSLAAGEHREIDGQMLGLKGGAGNDTFIAHINGLQQNSVMLINVQGDRNQDYADNFNVSVSGTLQTESLLWISLAGGRASNSIEVDAYTQMPTIQNGAILSMDLSGDGAGNTQAANVSTVGFAYRGLMDGKILFNIWGGNAVSTGTNQTLYALMSFNTGSDGSIGDYHPGGTSDDFIHAGGNDDMTFEMFGDTSKISIYDPEMIGGAGVNNLNVTHNVLNTWTGFTISGFQSSHIHVN
jgi:hypothetical protein